jgi:hypothetical protein
VAAILDTCSLLLIARVMLLGAAARGADNGSAHWGASLGHDRVPLLISPRWVREKVCDVGHRNGAQHNARGHAGCD